MIGYNVNVDGPANKHPNDGFAEEKTSPLNTLDAHYFRQRI